MPKTTHRLTAIRLHNLKKPGLHADGAGLYLKVAPSGSKSWVFRFMRERQSAVPRVWDPHASVKPRERPFTCRQLKRANSCCMDQDPIETRRQCQRTEARLADARAMTFRDCVEVYTWLRTSPAGRTPSIASSGAAR